VNSDRLISNNHPMEKILGCAQKRQLCFVVAQ